MDMKGLLERPSGLRELTLCRLRSGHGTELARNSAFNGERPTCAHAQIPVGGLMTALDPLTRGAVAYRNGGSGGRCLSGAIFGIRGRAASRRSLGNEAKRWEGGTPPPAPPRDSPRGSRRQRGA
ncbi:hypothetical protein AAFF_G00235660 [Aldrovandia affinis]|uniref:Uncharacterized protein n=1 Tax=Aldrovandia affinis TaxID=143900 RepID=A0AAD7SW69_9TELE|nr:hypothetical protein AAFF_G00235660 [Aldrovandia affinis]